MREEIKIINDRGMIWAVRIVRKGGKYGLNFCLEHDKDDPLVEFYDCRYEFTNYGQFVSRYYISTLIEGDQSRGLNLDGGVPSWQISGEAMLRVRAWLQDKK